MIRHGVDLIIGSHPHVVQPVRWEEEAGRKVLVVYSMGNFISNQQQPNTDGGIIYQVELVKSKKDAKAWVNKNGYVPVWRYIHKEGAKTTFYALPPAVLDEVEKLFPQMSAAAQAKMKTFLVGLRKRIGAENEWVSTKK